ncbi:MAG: alpha/beta hydrolase [Ilumatobacteraceae bacterium]
MTVVFVHGVPETAVIWDPMLAEFGRDDVVTLSPPGFGAPVPAGFETTSDGYADWLVGELEQIGSPVDLVGHDWGGGHAMRAATRRPDLVRRLVTDIAGTADSRYQWHDMATVWQTPGDGEAFVEAMATTPIDDRTARLVGAGMTEVEARSCAEANDADMGACILTLYRSAVQPRMTLWGDQFAELDDGPSTLVVVATDDHYTGGPDMARRVAERWGAAVAELDGLGHWWMMQDPARAAEALGAFLSG